MTDTPTSDLPEPELRPTRPPRAGYRKDEVDGFVAQLRAALRHERPSMAPYEVADQRFSAVRWRRGYDMRAVDDYLADAMEVLRQRHGEDAVASLAGHETPPRHVSTTIIYVVAAVLIAAMVVFAVLQL